MAGYLAGHDPKIAEKQGSAFRDFMSGLAEAFGGGANAFTMGTAEGLTSGNTAPMLAGQNEGFANGLGPTVSAGLGGINGLINMATGKPAINDKSEKEWVEGQVKPHPYLGAAGEYAGLGAWAAVLPELEGLHKLVSKVGIPSALAIFQALATTNSRLDTGGEAEAEPSNLGHEAQQLPQHPQSLPDLISLLNETINKAK